nr:MAG TPA: hypothetical protein [Caudoviricetes sp.]
MSNLENHYYLHLLALHLLVPTTVQAIFQYCPKHRYPCYFAKLLETSLALQLQFHLH